jgi:mannose-1-phosphate guanylyltransferase
MGKTFVPVILAGGSGTRFWPRSRRSRAKQVLALEGERTMIQQTLDRLQPLAGAKDVWVITNEILAETIGEQLPELDAAKILSEPAARNTAPACALAAFLVERTNPDAVLGIFPSDHVIGNAARFVEVLKAGIELAGAGETMVVLGVPPTRPETGYGYIEQGETVQAGSVPVRKVKRFTEKPEKALAVKFIEAGHYAWNSGMFLWSARTLAAAIRRHQPEMVEPLEKIAAVFGTPGFAAVFAEEYGKCKSISVDYAVLEPVSRAGDGARIVCIPADFAWNDLGSWAALHEHKMAVGAQGSDSMQNVVEARQSLLLSARGNYIYAPGKMVALIGVDNLVVVETEDAVLVTTRENSQRVGEIVKRLAADGHTELT